MHQLHRKTTNLMCALEHGMSSVPSIWGPVQLPYKLLQALSVHELFNGSEIDLALQHASLMFCIFCCMLCCVAQENAELREQQSAAEEKSRKADDRQKADACKQVCLQAVMRISAKQRRLFSPLLVDVRSQLSTYSCKKLTPVLSQSCTYLTQSWKSLCIPARHVPLDPHPSLVVLTNTPTASRTLPAMYSSYPSGFNLVIPATEPNMLWHHYDSANAKPFAGMSADISNYHVMPQSPQCPI